MLDENLLDGGFPSAGLTIGADMLASRVWLGSWKRRVKKKWTCGRDVTLVLLFEGERVVNAGQVTECSCAGWIGNLDDTVEEVRVTVPDYRLSQVRLDFFGCIKRIPKSGLAISVD